MVSDIHGIPLPRPNWKDGKAACSGRKGLAPENSHASKQSSGRIYRQAVFSNNRREGSSTARGGNSTARGGNCTTTLMAHGRRSSGIITPPVFSFQCGK
jgi:hypothetical protein